MNYTMWSCQGLNSWIINDNSCSKTINSTLNNSTSAKPTILAQASGKADYKTQHSTLPPAWFRSTGLSLFNHTCFTLFLAKNNSTLNNSTLRTAQPFKIQHSTLPPAWFRSTGLNLFNHTCFTLLHSILYSLFFVTCI